MEIRGDRECKECGTRWSYYETGSVACPECGSPVSVGVDDRKLHTAGPATLDLAAVRGRIDEVPLREVASDAAPECREYLRRRGFIDAGELCPLDDRYLLASELRFVADEVGRAMTTTDEERLYFLTLLRGTEQGERPPRGEVPESMRAARGLAYARAVGDYREDLRTYLGDDPDPTARNLVVRLRERVKRVNALDGDVPLPAADGLVRAARAIGDALAEENEDGLLRAEQRLDALGPDG